MLIRTSSSIWTWYRNASYAVQRGVTAALYSSLAGWMIPSSWIASLPVWARAEYFGEAVWQWVALLVLLLLAGLVAVACVRWSVRAPPEERPPLWRALVGPISLLVLSPVVSHLIDDQLWIGGMIRLALLRFLDALSYVAAAWGVLLVGKRTADAVASSRRLRPPINVQLARVGVHVVSYGLVLVILLAWADHLGIPLLARLTGLGIGGIALALAARKSIENVLGGFDLIADEPVRIGDRCRFGDTIGTVERIGLRSTRVRTPERTLLTIPNADFASLQLESISQRDRSLFRTTLGLQLDTSSEQRAKASVWRLVGSNAAASWRPHRPRSSRLPYLGRGSTAASWLALRRSMPVQENTSTLPGGRNILLTSPSCRSSSEINRRAYSSRKTDRPSTSSSSSL